MPLFLSAGRQYTSHSQSTSAWEEGLTTAAHSFHRWEHGSYQTLCKTRLVSDFGEHKDCVCQCRAVVLWLGLGICLPAVLHLSPPSQSRLPWSASAIPVPGTQASAHRPPLFGSRTTTAAEEGRKDWTPADKVEGRREKEEEKKGYRHMTIVLWAQSEGDRSPWWHDFCRHFAIQRCFEHGRCFGRLSWIWISMFQPA